MGPGVFLAVVGAILTFAVRVSSPALNVQMVGMILMIAGGGLIWRARRGVRRESVITRVENPGDPTRPAHVVKETVIDRDVEE